MTSSVAIALNTAPSASTSAPIPSPRVSTHGMSPDVKTPNDFRQPLSHAHQQAQHAQQKSTKQAASSKQATTDDAPSPRPGKATQAVGDDKPAAQDKDDAKPATDNSGGAAAAMLALLGQSIPASAAPAPAAAVPANGTDDSASAISLPTGMPVNAMPAMNMAALNLATDADDAVDGAKDANALKDEALSTSTSDDDADATAITAATTDLKAMVASAAPATNTQSNHNDPLDALRALSVSPMPQMPAANKATASPPAHNLTMQANVGTPAFAQELGQQVAWLGGQDIKQARITLHPEDLGQLDVKVSVQHDHVDVSFIAQHPQAVHAVQQTLSQLDAMLAHHGLTLGQAQVGQGGQGDRRAQGASPGSVSGGDAGASDDGAVASVVAPVVKAVGLLDMFA